MEKNNHLPFPTEKVTFFYEKETFCPEASGGRFWDRLTVSLHKTNAGCWAFGRNDIFLPIQSCKFEKIQNCFFGGNSPVLLLMCAVALLINVMNTCHLRQREVTQRWQAGNCTLRQKSQALYWVSILTSLVLFHNPPSTSLHSISIPIY